ncbi:MAG: hypothetical protein K1X28_00865 [Parachlamydiales bacterium]|nr:hypothetical protein [Parachlamydiales bacterium]
MIYPSAILDEDLRKFYVNGTTVKFAVHPQVASDGNVENIPAITQFPVENLEVTATSSSRTVAVLKTPEEVLPDHFVKLHFPYQITRSVRHLERRKLEHSVTVTDELAKSALCKSEKSFAFFPESLGIVFGQGEQSWGYLIREMTPYPRSPENRMIVPLFALYTPSSKLQEDQKLIIEELIEKSGQDPEAYLLENIYFPILKNWAAVFLQTGVLLEAHGQNTCFEFDDQGKFKRIVFRDFDTHVNKEIRDKNGLSMSGFNPYEVFSRAVDDGSHFSLIYDQAMKVPFDKLADFAEKRYKIPRAKLQEKCRSFLKDVFPGGCAYFPTSRKVYNYAPGVLKVGQKAKLVTTTDEPVWR